jgi:hypothetical protein
LTATSRRVSRGLTVFDARGQWLGNDGSVAREQSKALMLIHGKDGGSEEGLRRYVTSINRALPRSR